MYQQILLMKLLQISNEESNAIKGLLIFLIVLGHNSIFTNAFPGSFHYLYSFHVACFFILPCFYPPKHLKRERILNYAVRMYSPYIILFLLFFFVGYFANKLNLFKTDEINSEGKNLIDFLVALFNGGIYHIQKYIGFQYLWFLPVMFSFSIMKDYLAYTRRDQKIALLTGGMICFVCFYVFIYATPYPIKYNRVLELFSICSAFQALGFLFLGYVTVSFLRVNFKFFLWFSIIAFVGLSLLYWRSEKTEGMQWLLRCFMPIIVFSILFEMRSELAKIKVFCGFGQISLPIYLVQTPIAFIYCIVSRKFYPHDNLIAVVVSQFIIFTASYCLGLAMTKIAVIRRLLLPRSVEELLWTRSK